MTDKMFDLSSHIRRLPEAEKDHAWIVEHQFGDLKSYLDRFRDGLELLTFLRMDENTSKPSWVLIPCREAAMVLWHYMHALKAIRSNLANAPTLKAAISIRTIQEAIDEFDIGFPDVSGVRHSVGHTAELYCSPKEVKRNSLREPLSFRGISMPEGNIFLDCLETDTFATTSPNGVFVKLEMNNSSLEKLSSITAKAFTAISDNRLIIKKRLPYIYLDPFPS